jgi:hypothetical protein
MDARRIGLWLVAGGAVAQVSGLGLDAWSHAGGDVGPDGVLSLENAGHLLFVLGLVAVALGAVLALVGPRLYRPHPDAGPGVRLAQFGAPAVALLLVAGGMAGASSSSLTSSPASGDPAEAHPHDAEEAAPARCDLEANTAGYYREAVLAGVDLNGGAAGHGHADHDDAPSTPGIGDGEVAGVVSAAPPDAESHDDHDGPQTWTPLTDPEVCAQLDAELAQAAAVAARYPTAADAQAAGYMKVTNYIPGIASHWMNLRLVDETFAIDAPEMLLYDGNGLDARMVGLSYYLIGDPATPPSVGFAGGNTEYHRHIGLCVKDGLVVGGEQTSAEDCAARGGTKNDGSRSWMSHAWVVPGCESPWGVFSAKNPKLTAQLGERSGQGSPCSGSGTDFDDTPGVPAELAHVVQGSSG